MLHRSLAHVLIGLTMTCALGAGVSLASAADLDVVFLIDTTGSMSGEIKEAKERIHQLAVTLAEARKDKTIRFGVVAYRDRGDAYVTLVSPLDASVETSFQFLLSLQAAGGGDGPGETVRSLGSVDQGAHARNLPYPSFS